MYRASLGIRVETCYSLLQWRQYLEAQGKVEGSSSGSAYDVISSIAGVNGGTSNLEIYEYA